MMTAAAPSPAAAAAIRSALPPLLQALQLQLNAEGDGDGTSLPHPRHHHRRPASELSLLPPAALLDRLLQVLRAVRRAPSSTSEQEPADEAGLASIAATAFRDNHGWQTLLALLSLSQPDDGHRPSPQSSSSTAAAAAATTTSGAAAVPRLAAELLAALLRLSDPDQHWPRYLAARLTHLATSPASGPHAVTAGWHVLSAAAAASAPALARQLLQRAAPAAAAAAGPTLLAQLLQPLQDQGYQKGMCREAAADVASLLLRLAQQQGPCRDALRLAPPHHLPGALLDLHAALCPLPDLPAGFHCPAAAASAAAAAAAAAASAPRSSSTAAAPAAAGCSSCAALTGLLTAAGALVQLPPRRGAPDNGGGARRGGGGPADPVLALARRAAALVAALDEASPRRAAPLLAWDGSLVGYEQQPAAPEPCGSGCGGGGGSSAARTPRLGRPATAAAAAGGAAEASPAPPPPPPPPADSHLAAALQLLLSCCQQLTPALKRALHGSRDLVRLCARLSRYDRRAGSSPTLQALTQQLYGCMAQGFAGFRDDVLQQQQQQQQGPSGAGHPPLAALTGMMVHSSAPGVKLAALERLPEALRGCNGAEFVAFCEPHGGGVAWLAHQLLRQGQQQRRGGGGGGAETALGHAGAADGGALAAGGGGGGGGDRPGAAAPGAAASERSAARPAGLLQEAVSAAAAQAYRCAFDRAQRMRPHGSAAAGATAAPLPSAATAHARAAAAAAADVPGWGVWALLGPADVLLALQQAAALEPGAAAAPAAAPAAAAGPAPAAAAGPAPPRPPPAPPAASGAAPRRAPAAAHQSRAPAAAGVAGCAAGVPAAEGSSGLEALQLYDEDGLRVVWDSGPSGSVRAARGAWQAKPLRERVSWSQTLTDVEVRLLLPPGTAKRELAVVVTRARLTVGLAWCGRVVDGPLHRPVQYNSSCWSLHRPSAGPAPRSSSSSISTTTTTNTTTTTTTTTTTSSSGVSQQGDVEPEPPWSELLLLLPKERPGHYWKALFEGGEEKSYWELLADAVQCEEDAARGPSLDQLGPEAAALWEELRERAAAVASGELHLEHSFDDFRLVIGESTL